ncbi:MAG TPA: hypothetical protein VHJ38_00590 [Nitrososphaeraceae archaeon]|nr:hypothetical protein [Nitrososphaeraceae archaeon]
MDTVIMVTNILYNAKIRNMVDNRIIWIHKRLSEMIKPFEDEKRLLVKIMSTNSKGSMAEGGKFVVDKE